MQAFKASLEAARGVRVHWEGELPALVSNVTKASAALPDDSQRYVWACGRWTRGCPWRLVPPRMRGMPGGPLSGHGIPTEESHASRRFSTQA